MALHVARDELRRFPVGPRFLQLPGEHAQVEAVEGRDVDLDEVGMPDQGRARIGRFDDPGRQGRTLSSAPRCARCSTLFRHVEHQHGVVGPKAAGLLFSDSGERLTRARRWPSSDETPARAVEERTVIGQLGHAAAAEPARLRRSIWRKIHIPQPFGS